MHCTAVGLPAMTLDVIRFAEDDLELDLRAYELRRSGRSVKLERIPMELLLLLVERKGQLVTRDQIIDRLWGKQVFLDTDNSINAAIRKIRQVLNDDPEQPRFLQTVIGKGYRFIAPVAERDVLAVGQSAASTTLVEPAAVPDLNSADLRFVAEGQKKEPQSRNAFPLNAASSDVLHAPSTHSFLSWKLLSVFAGVLVAVLAAGIYRVRLRETAKPRTAHKRVMLAVLPFVNLSNDPTQEYFSDGLTEETITDLGELNPANLGVIARSSAMVYKHSDKTVNQIGRDLGVDYVLEGSVRREAGRARISAQLIRVEDQTHLWAQSYDRELRDLLGVQNELGRAISEQVQLNVAPEQRAELAKNRTVDPEAYDLYLRGRYHWNQQTADGIRNSIEYYQRAVQKDPNFAIAYAGLSLAYDWSSALGASSPMDSFPQAKAAATKALTLDPSLAEAHAALGIEKARYEFDWEGAQKEFLKALELNPNSARAHRSYCTYLNPMKRYSEAIAEAKKAIELDPLSPEMNHHLAVAYMWAGDYGRAVDQFRHVIEMDPNYARTHLLLSELLADLGNYVEAIPELEKGEVLMGTNPDKAARHAAVLRNGFQAGGAKGYWEGYLELALQATSEPDQYWFGSTEIAAAYARLGNKDKAFEWLDKAYQKKDGIALGIINSHPGFKTLHGDPRFTDLLHRLGLPE